MPDDMGLVAKLRAHEGLGAALARDSGQTGKYVGAVMDEAAAAIERLDHECHTSMATIASERARAEAAEATIERLLAERDEARAKVRDMHRRAQRAEGRVSAGLFLVELWGKVYGGRNVYVSTLLGAFRRCLSRRARHALQDSKP